MLGRLRQTACHDVSWDKNKKIVYPIHFGDFAQNRVARLEVQRMSDGTTATLQIRACTDPDLEASV